MPMKRLSWRDVILILLQRVNEISETEKRGYSILKRGYSILPTCSF
jgi:hypothetical protein